MVGDISINTEEIARASRNIWIPRAVITACAVISVMMGLSSGFNMNLNVMIVMAVSIAGSILFQFLLRRKKMAIIGYIVSVIGIAGVSVGMFTYISNGFSKLANDVLSTVNRNMAMANLLFVVDENSADGDVVITTIVMTLILTAIAALVIYFRLNLVMGVMILTAVTVSMLYKGSENPVWIAVGLVTIVLIMYIGNVHGRISADMYMHLGICIAALVGVTYAVFTYAGYSPLQLVDDVKENVQYHGENVIYGKSDYPEGKFSRFDDMVITGEERLRIHMDRPKLLYLRGFVGSKYTEEGWTDSNLNIYGGTYEGVFEWFASRQYSPLTNLSAYADQSKNHGGGMTGDKRQVQVSNISARRKYQYVPESVTYDSMTNLYAAKNDVNFRSQGIGRQTEYSYEICDVPENNYKKVYREDWYKDQSGDKEFHDSENVYGTFAREFYEDVPDDIKAYFDAAAPHSGDTLNPFDAIKVVRDYTAGNMSYSNEVKEYSEDKDFIVEQLSEHRSGYSAHFATVATMLFRYYGIPARYVEGYLVNPVSGETDISVTDEDSHAWTEIYVAGLGFIPIEVTPGYYSEEDDTGMGNSGGGHTPQTIPPQDDTQDEDDSDGGGGAEKLLIIVLFVMIACIAAFILVMIVRRIIVAVKRSCRMKSNDCEISIAASGDYMAALMRFCGRRLEDSLDTDVLDLLRRYKFSRYIPDENDAELVRSSAYKMRKKIVADTGAAGRIKLYFWNAL